MLYQIKETPIYKEVVEYCFNKFNTNNVFLNLINDQKKLSEDLISVVVIPLWMKDVDMTKDLLSAIFQKASLRAVPGRIKFLELLFDYALCDQEEEDNLVKQIDLSFNHPIKRKVKNPEAVRSFILEELKEDK
jgi:hypothetical protein